LPDADGTRDHDVVPVLDEAAVAQAEHDLAVEAAGKLVVDVLLQVRQGNGSWRPSAGP